ncbi:hypothetical protein EN745_16390 [Mesorhizobium sp. M4A.F.Ca.ET.022.05.2.1]|uniref:hypothetical protein n=1 Tax=Mesorhizobium sp. M4A.F.Ca.ET.022.05.2.1 TaxID=2496653 RepID=UPI000FCB53CA|nr:hypothetical protein [Mesorhizobium sp. M4A.F.Ca.ET.022.05.2.1]RVC79311.1 hypothetical protein EN745_16390 [Mesorhizobium sp. M4A.F.Ca.ET.022.05.2.1]
MSNIVPEQTEIHQNELLERCAGLQKQENIIEIMGRETGELGFAGNAKLPQLVYLTLLTGMFDRPVSLLIKGPSGAGKSFSLRMGKYFIPQSAYEEFEGMSEKAIIYLKDLSLKNRHLIIGEASGMADGAGRALLRQLLSEGKVRYATVESTDSGLKGSELPILEGPCGLIMTTTATGIHPEDENRMLAVDIKESPEQIKAALIAQAEGIIQPKSKPDTGPWFALYEYTQMLPKDVKIPFSKEIAVRMPNTHDKVKRDFPQILSLIRASALLHSCTREKDDNGHVIATIDDYRIVYDLANEAVSQGLAKSVPDNIRSLVEAVKAGKPFEELSITRLAEKLGRDISVVSRNAKKAVDEGYLIDTNAGQGRISKLVVGDRKLLSESAMPSPEEISRIEVRSLRKWPA